MRKFVQPNRFKQRPQKRVVIRTEAKKTSSGMLFLYYHRKNILAVLCAISILYLLFFHNRSPIQNVAFSESSLNELNYQEAYSDITTALVGKGYLKQKVFGRGDRISEIKKKYPLIKNIDIISFQNGTITLKVDYNIPDFIMNTENGSRFIIYHNSIVPFETGASLGSSGIQIQISLPEEMIESLSGGLFQTTPSINIARTVRKIDFLTGLSMITYYPGWEKLSLTHGKDTFIISLDEKKVLKTYTERKKILPYLPSTLPAKVDLSNPDSIIIQQ